MTDDACSDDGMSEDGNVMVSGRKGPVIATGSLDPMGPDASVGRSTVLLTPTGRPSKFQPLADFLSGCPYSYYDVNLDVLQQIMDGDLCDTAMTNRGWWFKLGPGTINDALGQVGWGVASADMVNGKIRFQHDVRRRRGLEVPERGYIARRDPVEGSKLVQQRDERMRKRRYGRMTEFLLGCGMDQMLLSFKRIGEIIGFRLPEGAWTDKRWWCNRREIYMLAAIEDGDFTKVKLDMEEHTVLLTRTCCVPDHFLEDVPEGGLPLKENMMR